MLFREPGEIENEEIDHEPKTDTEKPQRFSDLREGPTRVTKSCAT